MRSRWRPRSRRAWPSSCSPEPMKGLLLFLAGGLVGAILVYFLMREPAPARAPAPAAATPAVAADEAVPDNQAGRDSNGGIRPARTMPRSKATPSVPAGGLLLP